MTKHRDHRQVRPGGAARVEYSQELPETPEERERALPESTIEGEAKQKGPDPRHAATPFGGGTVNGSNDSSRFSTLPPKKT